MPNADEPPSQGELPAIRQESARIAGLLMEAIALLVDAGKTEDAWELFHRAFPGDRKQDWRVLVALELGRRRSSEQ